MSFSMVMFGLICLGVGFALGLFASLRLSDRPVRMVSFRAPIDEREWWVELADYSALQVTLASDTGGYKEDILIERQGARVSAVILNGNRNTILDIP